MDEFIKNGHTVFVVCSDEQGLNKSTRVSIEKNLHVLQVSSGNIKKAPYIKKGVALLLLGWQMKIAIRSYYKQVDFDLIVCSTPPITLSGLVAYLKNKYQIPVYLLLKDIWPQSSVDFHIIKKGSLIYRFFRYHEKKMYGIADMIGCMSPKGVEYIIKKNPFISTAKVEECPNSIIPGNKLDVDTKYIREKYQIPLDATVFIFSGNLGRGHGLEFLIAAIKALGDYKKAFFLIGGAGTHFEVLRKAFETMKPTNAYLYRRLPKEDFEQIIATSDVGLILLDRAYSVPQFPSRLLSYLENKKPVLCAINEGTDIGDIVELHKCGKSVLHGDMVKFVEAVRFFSENPEKRKEMGKNARKLLIERYTADKSYRKIVRHFDIENSLKTNSTATM
jgi:glycosyltransferase involved in cell wall biosynthesis